MAGLGFIVSVELEPELELNSNHAHYLSNNIFCKGTFFLYEEKKKKKRKKKEKNTTIILLPAVFFRPDVSWTDLPFLLERFLSPLSSSASQGARIALIYSLLNSAANQHPPLGR